MFLTGKLDNGAEQNAEVGADTLTEEHAFIISALAELTGEVQVTVTATDQAGNETTETKTVKIKSKSAASKKTGRSCRI